MSQIPLVNHDCLREAGAHDPATLWTDAAECGTAVIVSVSRRDVVRRRSGGKRSHDDEFGVD